MGFLHGWDGKESSCNAGDLGSIHGLGRTPGEGNSNPFQYLCLGILLTEESGRLQSMGLQRVGHNWVIKHIAHNFIFGEGQRQCNGVKTVSSTNDAGTMVHPLSKT